MRQVGTPPRQDPAVQTAETAGGILAALANAIGALLVTIARAIRDFWLELALALCLAGVVIAVITQPILISWLILFMVLVCVYKGRPTARWILHAAKVRRAWRQAAEDCGLHDKIRRVRPSPAGDRLDIRIARGHSITNLQKQAEALAGCLHIRETRIEQGDNAGHAVVTLVRRDPFAEMTPAPWPGLNPTTPPSLWDPAPAARDENATLLPLSLPYRTVLVGGVPDSGKTVFLHSLIAWAALDPKATLLIADGKELDFPPWRHRCLKYANADSEEFADLLNAAREWMAASRDRLTIAGREKVMPGDPLCLLIIDEITAYPDIANPKSQAYKDLMHCVSRGRALGLITVVATQRPSVNAVPGDIRANVDYRAAFRCKDTDSSKTILGTTDDAWNAARLPDRPGLAIFDTGGKRLLARTFLLTRDDVDVLVERSMKVTDGPGASVDYTSTVVNVDPGLSDGSERPLKGATDDPGRNEQGPAGQNGGPNGRRPSRSRSGQRVVDEVAEQLAALLTETPASRRKLARQIGREPDDATVKRALPRLEEQGRAQQTSKGWIKT